MREANARLYLDNSKVYAEIAQLALPVGDEDFNRMCREATKRMIEEEKRMTEKQAVNYLTNSLQIVKNQPLALLPELEAMGKLDKVGGLEYLSSLPDKVPTTANVDRYIKIVEEKALTRNLIQTANELISLRI